MKGIDFLRLDNAINNLMIEEESDVNNASPLSSYDLTTVKNLPSYEECSEKQDRIHKIDIEAIKEAIINAIGNKKNKSDSNSNNGIKHNNKEQTTALSENSINTITFSGDVKLDHEKQFVSVSSNIINSKQNITKEASIVLKIIEDANNNRYPRKHFIYNNKPFVLYNPIHDHFAQKIYAAGLTSVINVIINNSAFRNEIHVSPFCTEVKKIINSTFSMVFNNVFEILCFNQKTTISNMPVCSECCNIVNIPDLSDNIDYVAVLDLVASMSV